MDTLTVRLVKMKWVVLVCFFVCYFWTLVAQDTILTGHHKFGLVIHHFCESIIFNFDVALKFMLSLTPANFFLSNAFFN